MEGQEAKTRLEEVSYLHPKYGSREELEGDVDIWDSTSAGDISRCPRHGYYKQFLGLQLKEPPVFLKAGLALHAGIDSLYIFNDVDVALEELRAVWGEDFILPADNRLRHITLGFLEVVLRNYDDWRRRRDAFTPLLIRLEDINMDSVLAAVWRVTPDGWVVLGESKIIMQFDVEDETEPFVYAVKPDMVVQTGPTLYVLDHKCTTSAMSDWYFSMYRYSNQIRGYCAALTKLLERRIEGGIINGIGIGEKAVSTTTKAAKFLRYRTMLYRQPHLDEAIRNQLHWLKTLRFHESQRYFPQEAKQGCRSCQFDALCGSSPAIRRAVIKQQYEIGAKHFLDL